MKHLRREDGYVLPYVLIVFAVVSLIAVSICSVAIRNLRTQEAAVQRTQALYAAEGAVERFTAKVSERAGDAEHTSEQDALNELEAKIRAADTDSILTDIEVASTEVVLTLQAKSGSALVDSVVKMGVTLYWWSEPIDIDAEGNIIESIDYCKVTDVSAPIYESYNISYNAAAEPGGGEPS